jgi:hypothetical protein
VGPARIVGIVGKGNPTLKADAWQILQRRQRRKTTGSIRQALLDWRQMTLKPEKISIINNGQERKGPGAGGDYTIIADGTIHDHLCWDEMLGQVASLTLTGKLLVASTQIIKSGRSERIESRRKESMSIQSIMAKLRSFINTPDCSCQACKDMCKRPCWGTPAEMEKIIAAGFGSKLMLDYYVMDDETVYNLCGAFPGYEAKEAPFWPGPSHGKCMFLTPKRSLCQLHRKGLKPIEGRVAHHSDVVEKINKHFMNIHYLVELSWQTKRGRELIASFRKQFQKEKEAL